MPLFGGLLRGVIRERAQTVVKNIAEQVIAQHDRQDAAGNYTNTTSTPSTAASVIASQAAPAVVAALKENPSIRKAINGEPIWQSQFFYMGVTAIVSGVTGLIAQWQTGHIDPTAFGASVVGVITGISMVLRRAALQT